MGQDNITFKDNLKQKKLNDQIEKDIKIEGPRSEICPMNSAMNIERMNKISTMK
jgi:hypothetical protein